MTITRLMATIAVAGIGLGGALAADIAALEADLEKARLEAPMTVQSFMLVKEPATFFGDFSPRNNANFKAGEDMYLYGEPRNLVFPKGNNGKYTIAFAVDLEVTDASGKAMKKDNFEQFKLESRSRLQDLYLNLRVALTNAPPGKYNVKFRIRDKNSKKVAEVAQDVMIK
jgi:hypothetical protein